MMNTKNRTEKKRKEKKEKKRKEKGKGRKEKPEIKEHPFLPMATWKIRLKFAAYVSFFRLSIAINYLWPLSWSSAVDNQGVKVFIF